MGKKLIAGALLGMGLLATSWGAMAADNLFKNYTYGTSVTDFKES